MNVFLTRFANGSSAVANFTVLISGAAFGNFFVMHVLGSWSLNLFKRMDGASDLLRSGRVRGSRRKELGGRLAGVDRLMVDVVLKRDLLSAIGVEETIS